jgi:hypothetical protein
MLLSELDILRHTMPENFADACGALRRAGLRKTAGFVRGPRKHAPWPAFVESTTGNSTGDQS